jgi:hypothetical protein
LRLGAAWRRMRAQHSGVDHICGGFPLSWGQQAGQRRLQQARAGARGPAAAGWQPAWRL